MKDKVYWFNTGKWEASPEATCVKLAQEKYFDTIENTFKKQEDCNKYCFKQKNIAQQVPKRVN